jgi:CRISPR/Cas system Type II protein with McrA/HNH and RuvC-like nuclease domain
MKKILSLDLGTNSIGWALIDKDAQKILGMGYTSTILSNIK